MRRSISIILVLCFICNIFLVGCGVRKAASAQDAIKRSQVIDNIQKKAQYLMDQAQAFFNDKDFKTAIDIAQYILRKVNATSEQAKTLVRRAQDAMAVQLQIKAREAEEGAQATGE